VLKEGPDWKQVSGTFTTSPQTNLLVLRVRRLPEGSPIRGKLWISDFRLVNSQHAQGESRDAKPEHGG
jgi:hypothetical protein